MTKDLPPQEIPLVTQDGSRKDKPKPARHIKRLWPTAKAILIAGAGGLLTYSAIKAIEMFHPKPHLEMHVSANDDEVTVALAEVFESINLRVKDRIAINSRLQDTGEDASISFSPPLNIHAYTSYEPTFSDKTGEVNGAEWELRNLIIKHRRRNDAFSDFVSIGNGSIPGSRVFPDDGSGLGPQFQKKACRYRVSWYLADKPLAGDLESSTVGESSSANRTIVVILETLDGKTLGECGLR